MISFEWMVPTLGKSLKWAPLKAQRAIEVAVASDKMPGGAKLKEQLMARIVFYDSHEGGPSGVEFAEWEDVDLEMFMEEVETRESARRVALRKKQATDGLDPAAELKRVLQDLSALSLQMNRAANAVLEAQAVLEASVDPLASKQS